MSNVTLQSSTTPDEAVVPPASPVDKIQSRVDGHRNVVITLNTKTFDRDDQARLLELVEWNGEVLRRPFDRDDADAPIADFDSAPAAAPRFTDRIKGGNERAALIVDARQVQPQDAEFVLSPLLKFLGQRGNSDIRVVVACNEGQNVASWLSARPQGMLALDISANRGTPGEISASLAAGQNSGAIYRC